MGGTVGMTTWARRGRDGLLQNRTPSDLAAGVDTSAERRRITECTQVGHRVRLRACVGSHACQASRNDSGTDDQGKYPEGHHSLDEWMEVLSENGEHKLCLITK